MNAYSKVTTSNCAIIVVPTVPHVAFLMLISGEHANADGSDRGFGSDCDDGMSGPQARAASTSQSCCMLPKDAFCFASTFAGPYDQVL